MSERSSGGAAATGAPRPGLTYAAAGVDVAAGDRAVELMKASVAATHGPEVLVGAGGFAGLVDASALKAYRRPLLATSTDGVGTKVAIAQAMDRHDTIGQDLVAMVVDDLVACGARPLYLTDYIACGSVVPERIATLVDGIARACAATGTALVGGETAEHPGLMAPHEYDLAAAATGVVEADDLLGPERVREGDVILALASSGLHANGFSLVRRVVAEAGCPWDRHVEELGRTLGEEVLEPTALYAPVILGLAGVVGSGLHAVSHVTGGGIAANLARVMPLGLDAVVDRSSWAPAPVFGLVAAWGGVAVADLEAAVNCGVGMLTVVAPQACGQALEHLGAAGADAWVAGEVVASSPRTAGAVRGSKGIEAGGALLVGAYR